ncbi:MAG: SBBP repeat-containing protein, partial [Promethearchaeota archaeon]
MKLSKLIILLAGISIFIIGAILIGFTIWNIIIPTPKAEIIEWNSTWGGDGNDYGNGIAIDSLDNVYIVGSTGSFGAGSSDIVLVKYNENGQEQWNCTWGGDGNDYGNGIAIDSLDNIYIVGSTGSFGAENNDFVLVKYDNNGVQQWNRTWDGGYDDYARDVAVDSSGNIFIVGDKFKLAEDIVDILLVKYDNNGVQQWNCTWDRGYYDYGNGVAIDSSNDVFIVGDTATKNGDGMYSSVVLVKYDQNGIQQWNHTLGKKEEDNFGNAVIVDTSDNVYLVGTTPGPVSICALLVKYNGSGIKKWNRIWGEFYTYNSGNDVAVDLFGNVYLVGAAESGFEPGNYDAILLKYDGNGTLQNNYTWGGDQVDIGYGVAVNSLGNVYIVGYTNSFGAGEIDMFLVKYRNIGLSFNNVVMIQIIVPIESLLGVIIIFIKNHNLNFINKTSIKDCFKE